MRPSPAVILSFAAVLLISAVPGADAASYHSFTWDPEYDLEGIDVIVGHPDPAHIEHGSTVGFTIASDIYDVSQMSIYVRDSSEEVVDLHEDGEGAYSLVMQDDYVLTLGDFVLLPSGGSEEDPVPVTPEAEGQAGDYAPAAALLAATLLALASLAYGTVSALRPPYGRKAVP
ncbi:MAG: hypothetical protein RBQ77_04675 [Candidatus Methanomethylophilaceae archaeon]|jgi:hypothetical protein|nr:hypothetical protein [Candidatus Methanomethylophilaceae archaeon]NLF33863.1 hypothetical protein [Thermoplasmatales archaeon]